jgi:tRNA modification GTPase
VFSTADTIAAIATPAGRGGIGVVRLAGPAALEIAGRLLHRSAPLIARHATLGHVRDPETGAPIDEVVATWFEAPQSYTGDDVVELSAHGSPIVLTRIVEGAIELGARLAEPGEFTLRAYLNGKLDLAQAEAVADLVDAVTPLQARAAMDQLEGTLTTAISRIDAALFDLTARLEASLDFPEEGFHFVSRQDAIGELDRARRELDALVREGRAGRVIREGRTVVILGRPNAGKSSLFNALIGAARAIVTDVPGTTRDLLTERVDIEGLPITLVDTAGLREAQDQIEAEGVRRARQAQTVAALAIVVLDGSAPLTAEDRDLLQSAPPSALLVHSKSDLPPAWTGPNLFPPIENALPVSAHTGQGLDVLKRRIASALTAREDLRDPPVISNLRHLVLVEEAGRSLGEAADALAAGATEEIALADLHAARRSLEAITGHRTDEDLLRHIFTRFCIGK